jgi:hypothetical protein
MKRLFILNLILLLAITCKSQDYIPFPDSNAIWKVVWYAPFPQLYDDHYDYVLEGDTIINNVEYVELRIIELGIKCSLDTFSNVYSGAIRNDILARKVYYNHPIFQQDTLLYDFALIVGDTVPRTIQNSMFPYLSVKEIDTVIINNKPRKRYTYWEGPDPLGYKFYVYEGFGAEVGLLEDYRNGENPYYLKCFHHNDTLEYINPGDTTCRLETDTCLQTYINPPVNIGNHFFKVYCTSNQIVVRHNFEMKDLSIRVFNAGSILIYQSKVHSAILNIDKNRFQNGLYFFSLQTANRIISTQKLMINQ